MGEKKARRHRRGRKAGEGVNTPKVLVVDMTSSGEVRFITCQDAGQAANEIARAQRASCEAKDGSPLGVMLDFTANGNREPLHLLPSSLGLERAPSHPDVEADAAAIRSAWLAAEGPVLDFVFTLDERGLSAEWHRYLSSEQRYMDLWAPMNADLSRACPNVTADSAELLLWDARIAWTTGRARTKCPYRDSLQGFSGLCLPRSPHLLDAFEKACCGHEGIWLDRTVFPGYGVLTFPYEDMCLTKSVAGLKAAGEVLLSHGVGCAPWAAWD